MTDAGNPGRVATHLDGQSMLDGRATGVRFSELPMSPPRILAALDAAKEAAE